MPIIQTALIAAIPKSSNCLQYTIQDDFCANAQAAGINGFVIVSNLQVLAVLEADEPVISAFTNEDFISLLSMPQVLWRETIDSRSFDSFHAINTELSMGQFGIRESRVRSEVRLPDFIKDCCSPKVRIFSELVLTKV